MSAEFIEKSYQKVSTYLCQTSKFKTNHLTLYIRQPLSEENHTKVALIPAILKRGTMHYPTAQKLKQALDDLYGAQLSVDVSKKGNEQIVAFRLQVANERFLKDETALLNKAVQLLGEVILNPLLEEDSFSEKNVKLEKDLLHRRLSQIKDDKIRYANMRCVQEMYQGDPFSLLANGSIDQLDRLSVAELYQYYQQMLNSHPIDLFVVGDVNAEQLQNAIAEHLKLPAGRQVKQKDETNLALKGHEQQEIIERTKISQGKLHIGCRTNVSFDDSDYLHLLVCNSVFGGFSNSKLFRNVREKESLAYYVQSSLESHKGLMMIMSGIEYQNYEKTVQIIKEQLAEVVQGNISTDEISQAKAVLINQLKQANDQPFQLMERYYHGVIGGLKRSTEEVINEIEKVSVQQIQDVAGKIEIDTIYFLTTDEQEADVTSNKGGDGA